MIQVKRKTVVENVEDRDVVERLATDEDIDNTKLPDILTSKNANFISFAERRY